jgi:hypothetical protein
MHQFDALLSTAELGTESTAELWARSIAELWTRPRDCVGGRLAAELGATTWQSHGLFF